MENLWAEGAITPPLSKVLGQSPFTFYYVQQVIINK